MNRTRRQFSSENDRSKEPSFRENRNEPNAVIAVFGGFDDQKPTLRWWSPSWTLGIVAGDTCPTSGPPSPLPFA